MPPNIKFPAVALGVLVSDEQELLDATRSNNNNQGSSAAPPPPLLTLDNNTVEEEDHDETFVFHDIEENVESPPPSNPESPAPNDDQESAILSHHHDQHHHHHHRVIKHLASQIMDPEELSIDDRRLSRAVRDAGEFSYGVIACEVWLLDDDEKLVRPPGGWWHNAKLLYQHHSNGSLLEELETTTPAPVLPGVDLPGILWAETDRDASRGTLASRSGSFFAGHRSTDDLNTKIPHHQHHRSTVNPSTSHEHPMGRSGPSTEGLLHLTLHHNPHALVWRDLLSIAEDPDSAKTERLGQLMKAGLGAAAGIPFHVRNHRGLVIYFARSHTRTHLISNIANDAFLKASAEMIGHAAALSEIRRASVEARRRYHKDASQRFRSNLIEEFRKNNKGDMPKDFAQVSEQNNGSWRCGEEDTSGSMNDDDRSALEGIPPDEHSLLEQAHHGIHAWYHKCKGGNLQVPPALTLRQSLWTILGAFCGLVVLSSLNEYYMMLSDDDYFLLIGPFGALMTLQYGLTSAPASQPRNAILGQAVSGAVSLAFTYIPESILAVWLRRAVGPAVAIGVMVKCGVTHPPAGAHAVLYASGKYNFGFYALVVLSSAISVIPATFVNNMSSKRQYPTYWTLLKLPVKSSGAKKGGKE